MSLRTVVDSASCMAPLEPPPAADEVDEVCNAGETTSGVAGPETADAEEAAAARVEESGGACTVCGGPTAMKSLPRDSSRSKTNSPKISSAGSAAFGGGVYTGSTGCAGALAAIFGKGRGSGSTTTGAASETSRINSSSAASGTLCSAAGFSSSNISAGALAALALASAALALASAFAMASAAALALASAEALALASASALACPAM